MRERLHADELRIEESSTGWWLEEELAWILCGCAVASREILDAVAPMWATKRPLWPAEMKPARRLVGVSDRVVANERRC